MNDFTQAPLRDVYLRNFLRDVYFTIIDKTDPKKPTKQNDYRIHTPEAKALMGLTVEAGLQT